MSEDEKKNQFLLSNAFNVYNMEVNILLLRLDIFQKSLWISSHFDTKNYIGRLDLVFLSKTIQHIKNLI